MSMLDTSYATNIEETHELKQGDWRRSIDTHFESDEGSRFLVEFQTEVEGSGEGELLVPELHDPAQQDAILPEETLAELLRGPQLHADQA